MMTSAAKICLKDGFVRGGQRGFTLLEAVIALSLITLLMGLGIVKYANGATERKIRQAVSRIEAMSSRGHAMSILHQKPFWLRLEEGKVVLAGADVNTVIAGEDDARKPDLTWEEEDENQSSEIIYDTFSTDVFVSLRRWGAKDDAWSHATEKESIVWKYQSSGLCEPVSFRLELEDSWVVMTMHPLTARIEDEESEIR